MTDTQELRIADIVAHQEDYQILPVAVAPTTCTSVLLDGKRCGRTAVYFTFWSKNGLTGLGALCSTCYDVVREGIKRDG